MRPFLLIGILAALLLPATSLANTKESDNTLFGRKQENLIRETSDKGVGPSTLIGNQVYVIAYVGAAYCTVLALGSTQTDPAKLASVLDAWQHSHGLNRTVEWARDDDGAAASLKFQAAGHIGLTASKTSLEFGSIVKGFKDAGFKPSAIGRIGNYADLEGAGESFGGTSSKLYDLSSLPETGTISVHAEIPRWESALLLIWPFFVPIITLLGFGIASLYARLPAVPITDRRRTYQKLVLGSAFGSIAIHALSFMFLMTSGGLSKVCDLWFGTSSTIALVPLIPTGLLFLIPMIPLGKAVEKKLFGPSPQSTVVLPTLTPAEKALNRRRAWFSLGIAAVPFAIYTSITFGTSPKSPVHALGMPFMLLALIGPTLLSRRWVAVSADFEAGPPEPDLSALAAEIAHRMQVRLPKITITRTPMARTYIFGSASSVGLTLSQGTVDNLTREEMSFFIAQKLALAKARKDSRAMWVIMLPFVVLIGTQLYVFLSPPPHPLWVLPLTFGFMMAYIFAAGFWMRRTSQDSELEADRLAVGVTGDLASAISCLEKCAQYSAMPGLHDIDTSSRPSLPRRIDALRAMVS